MDALRPAWWGDWTWTEPKLGDRVVIHDEDNPPGHDESCDGVTGVVVEIDTSDSGAPGVVVAHDAPWRHMDGNWYRMCEVEVLA